MKTPLGHERRRLAWLLKSARNHCVRMNERHAELVALLCIAGDENAIGWLDDFCMGIKTGDLDELLSRIGHATSYKSKPTSRITPVKDDPIIKESS